MSFAPPGQNPAEFSADAFVDQASARSIRRLSRSDSQLNRRGAESLRAASIRGETIAASTGNAPFVADARPAGSAMHAGSTSPGDPRDRRLCLVERSDRHRPGRRKTDKRHGGNESYNDGLAHSSS